jgi:hypothetical protein
MIRCALLSFVALCALGTSRAAAQAEEAPEARVIVRPIDLFDRATRALNEGRCAEARELFGQVHDVSPRPSTAFNLAVAMICTGEFRAAVALLDELLEGGFGELSDEVRALVVERRELAAQGLAHLSIEVSPRDARVRIDGESIARDMWPDVPLDPGRHAIDATAEGHTLQSRWIDLASRDRESVRFDLERIETPRNDTRESAGDPFWDSAWPWVIGAAILAAGGVAIGVGVWAADPSVQDVDEVVHTLIAF